MGLTEILVDMIPILIFSSLIAVLLSISTYRFYREHGTGTPFDRVSSTVSRVRAVDRKTDRRRGLKQPFINGRNDSGSAAPIPIQKMWPDAKDPVL